MFAISKLQNNLL